MASATTPSVPPTAGDKDSFKADARESRLTNTMQGRIDEEWRKKAYVTCDPAVKAFWVCRNDDGFKSVFTCRHANAAMNDCLNSAFRDTEKYEAYKTKRAAELAAERQAAILAHMAKMGVAGGAASAASAGGAGTESR